MMLRVLLELERIAAATVGLHAKVGGREAEGAQQAVTEATQATHGVGHVARAHRIQQAAAALQASCGLALLLVLLGSCVLRLLQLLRLLLRLLLMLGVGGVGRGTGEKQLVVGDGGLELAPGAKHLAGAAAAQHGLGPAGAARDGLGGVGNCQRRCRQLQVAGGQVGVQDGGVVVVRGMRARQAG